MRDEDTGLWWVALGAALLLILLTTFACTIPIRAWLPEGNDDRGFISGLVARTVAIDVQCDGRSSWGSGVALGGELVATAGHVVDINCRHSVGGLPVEILSDSDDDPDLALLRVSGLHYPKAEFAHPYLGMDVIAVGYPNHPLVGQRGLSVTRGTLSAYYPQRHFYRFSAPIWYGSSGGGVWDNHGRLVGLSVAMLLGFPGEFYLTPNSYIRELLDSD